jgi:ribonucleoside-diphosphate reductase subunit M1
MYNRRTLAGEFTCVNKYLLKDLTERNLWTADIRNQLIAAGGSVQNISEIPQVRKHLHIVV